MKWLKRSVGILALVSAGAFVFQAIPFIMAGMPLSEMKEAGTIGIIGGADGPTAIYTAVKIAPYYKFTAISAIVLFIFWIILHAKSKNK